jgi:N6-L-threonylcarbamoyladenine synthase
VVSLLAESGKPGRFDLPRPMLHSGDLDFSFSGLKTAVLNQVNRFRPESPNDQVQFEADLAYAFVESLVDVLVQKSAKAIKQTGYRDLVLAGGVGANKQLRAALNARALRDQFQVHYPPLQLCTDNGVMIAFAGALRLLAGHRDSDTAAFDVKPRWDLTAA